MGKTGKSAVLKDLTGRPAGYMRIVPDGVMLRAPLEAPAQLGLVFSDGASQVYPLSAGKYEQHICCDCGDAVGCCVFCEQELLLVSDEAVRRAFEGQICRKKRAEAGRREPVRNDQPDIREISEEKQRAFAQPRWPPPACWNTARYQDGVWREE